MLPAELLITRTKKDRIYPDFVQIDAEHLELADELIELYRTFEGKKKGEIDEIVVAFEQGLDFKRVRGLRTLLERRCSFTSQFTIEPMQARRAVFAVASSKNVTNRKERATVIDAAAARLHVSPADLERSLWADNESEMVLDAFAPLKPEELLKRYNLALAQTLLFKSAGMTIAVKGSSKELFRAITYLGLMYTVEGDTIRIEGPSALLKLSERYGTSLAKLLPAIVTSDEWEIDADIVIRRAVPRVYHFLMDSSERELLMSREHAAAITFDSSVEERFYTAFLASSASRSWELIREPDVVFTGKGVFIPDFKFRHKELGIEVYFEIVGFWTAEYLKRKLSKLRAVPFTILVAVDKHLACFNSTHFTLDLDQPVILYSRNVPVGEVLTYLAAMEREAIAREVASFEGTRIALEGDIIALTDIAMRYKISKEAVRACFNTPGYVLFKAVAVKKVLLNEVKEKLASINSYLEARRIIADVGLFNPDEVLAELGFTVKWKGLDAGAATIEAFLS